MRPNYILVSHVGLTLTLSLKLQFRSKISVQARSVLKLSARTVGFIFFSSLQSSGIQYYCQRIVKYYGTIINLFCFYSVCIFLPMMGWQIHYKYHYLLLFTSCRNSSLRTTSYFPPASCLNNGFIFTYYVILYSLAFLPNIFEGRLKLKE